MRNFGRSPAVTCKSDAFRSIISSRSRRRFTPEGLLDDEGVDGDGVIEGGL
jgi:hypothetical protein